MGTATEFGTLDAANRPPIARDTSAAVVERQSVRGFLVANDPDGDGLDLVSVSADGITKPVKDFMGTIAGQYGTLTFYGSGYYSYEANGEGGVVIGGKATDTFTFKVADEHGATDTARLTITVTGSSDGDAGDNLFLLTGSVNRAVGGDGDDTYVVDNAADRIVEKAREGTDLVKASASYTLTTNLENLTLTGKADIDGTGNTVANTIRGNGGDNVLAGRGGNDVLTGGSGHDTFLFDTKPGAGNVDHITDFSPRNDTIALDDKIFRHLDDGPLLKGQFKDITHGATLDADDRILYDRKSGNLFYDADGSGSGAQVQVAVIDNHAGLTFQNFDVV